MSLNKETYYEVTFILPWFVTLLFSPRQILTYVMLRCVQDNARR